MQLSNKLELHYHFDDKSHSMDAHVRNKCESELLALIKEVSKISELEISLDAEALREGGLRNVWKFLGDNGNQITVLVALVALILQTIEYYESKEDVLDRELKKLSIEEKKLTIEKLKNEASKGQVSERTITEAANCINLDFKVLTRKSNFYKHLDNYQKISKIDISSLSKDNIPIKEYTIDRSNFYKYILSTDKLSDEIIEDAEIEIVSPVIVDQKLKWKGIYNERTINFGMNDSNFSNEVLSKQVSFQNGAKIICVLVIHYALDNNGEVVTTGYSVTTVIKKVDGNSIHETPQGKRYKRQKRLRDGQKDLF